MYQGTLRPVTNRATWIDVVEIRDDETGDLFDLTDVDEIVMELCDTESRGTVLSGTLTGTEIVVTGTGTFQFTFTASQMRGLCADTYDLGVTIEIDDETIQLILGRVPVLNGVVS